MSQLINIVAYLQILYATVAANDKPFCRTQTIMAHSLRRIFVAKVNTGDSENTLTVIINN